MKIGPLVSTRNNVSVNAGLESGTKLIFVNLTMISVKKYVFQFNFVLFFNITEA